MFEEDSREEFKDLIEAVTEAIKSSEKVKEILYKLYQEKTISPKAILALFLKMHVSFLENEVNQERIKENDGSIDDIKVSPYPKTIDGRLMSPREAAFEDYCREKFDEKKWLKQLGIKFEN
ncbi:MAG TPA: hypothetical protein VMW81_05980 [Nitrospinota bacterium]|nr:hypothetical protein [Nitrospinota bacterium]